MAELVQFPDSKGRLVTYSGTFLNPYLDSIDFNPQGRMPICLPTAFRVALQGLGITNIRGVPLNDNRRMVNIFHACGIEGIEKTGSPMAVEIKVIKKIPELNSMLTMGTIGNDPLAWAKSLIGNQVLLVNADSARFYNNPQYTDKHALTVLGVDIPRPQENRDLGFLVYDPNTYGPRWFDSSLLFPSLDPQHVVLGRQQHSAG